MSRRSPGLAGAWVAAAAVSIGCGGKLDLGGNAPAGSSVRADPRVLATLREDAGIVPVSTVLIGDTSPAPAISNQRASTCATIAAASPG